MQLTGVPQVVAPLATGHPLGLPGAPVRTAEETKVQPVKEQSATDTDHATDHGAEGQAATGLWRSLTGLPDPANHVAPPSIMQIRISALLEEQAEALLKELRDKAIAHITASTPQGSAAADNDPQPAGAEETSEPVLPDRAAGTAQPETRSPPDTASESGQAGEGRTAPPPQTTASALPEIAATAVATTEQAMPQAATPAPRTATPGPERGGSRPGDPEQQRPTIPTASHGTDSGSAARAERVRHIG